MAVCDVDVSVPIEEEHVPQIIVSTIDHVVQWVPVVTPEQIMERFISY